MKKLLFFLGLLALSFNFNSQMWGAATPFPGASGSPGASGEIYCMLNFDNQLYVGGDFNQIGGIVAFGLASWDGLNWHTIAPTPGNGGAKDMVEFNNSLFFTGNKLFKWNGVSLSEFSYFNTNYQSNFEINGSDLHVFNNELYIIAQNPSIILKYNGISFSEILIDSSMGNIQCIDDYNNQLFIGTSNGLYKLVNSGWEKCSGVAVNDPMIYDIESYNNELYVIGNFNSIGGISVKNFAKFNGNIWSNISLPDGFWPTIFPGVVKHNALKKIQGSLYVSAEFASMQAFNFNPSPLYKYNGSQWLNVAVNNHCSSDNGCSRTSEIFNNELYCGGSFMFFSDDPYCSSSIYIIERIAKLDPNALSVDSVPDNSEVSISPNPTAHTITIKGEKNLNQTFHIYDQMGREVFKGKLTGTETDVNLSSLSKGMYTLKIEGNYQPSQIVKE